jgi:hypothetical protein
LVLRDGKPHEMASEHELFSNTRLYPSGAHVTWSNQAGASRLWLTTADGEPKEQDFEGIIYAVTRWDEEHYLVHVARQAQGGTDLSAHVVDTTADRPRLLSELNEARASWDRRRGPGLALLPSKGNGRPVFVRVSDALVLITGQGDLWAWELPVASTGASVH